MLKKGRKFEWRDEHTGAVRKMKEALAAAPALRKAVYNKDTPIYVTVDMSPTGIGWVINQEDEDDMQISDLVRREGPQRATVRIRPGQTRALGYRVGGEGR